MAAFKLYAWEHKTFPWHQTVLVRSDLRVYVAQAIAKLYGLTPRVCLNKRRDFSGSAKGEHCINLPIPGRLVSLGTIIHEVAHCLTHNRDGRWCAHNSKFKRNLIKIYVEANRRILKEIFLRAKADSDHRKLQALRLAKKYWDRAKLKVELKKIRDSRPMKIQRLELQIRRLETKRKRIETLLKSRRWSLMALNRLEKAEQDRIVDQQVAEALSLEEK